MLSIIIAAIVVILDQISKLICVNNMELGQSFEIIPGILKFTHIQNKGAAFGMLSDNRWVFMIISVIVIIAMIVALKYFKPSHKLYYISISMILGGGIGNMIDRVRLGYVVDFVDFCAFDFWKWVFNVADIAVTVGCILFIVYLIFYDRPAKHNEVEQGSESNE